MPSPREVVSLSTQPLDNKAICTLCVLSECLRREERETPVFLTGDSKSHQGPYGVAQSKTGVWHGGGEEGWENTGTACWRVTRPVESLRRALGKEALVSVKFTVMHPFPLCCWDP